MTATDGGFVESLATKVNYGFMKGLYATQVETIRFVFSTCKPKTLLS